jgi:hypothetical protein
MNLELKRRWLTPRSTIGELYVDGAFECFILEDRYRPPPEPKVFGQTAIPCGRFEVRITPSPRFKRDLPLVMDVPGFKGIRIHAGNDASHTEGCLLPGRERETDKVLESTAAFNALFEKIKNAQGPHCITITIGPPP